MSYNSNMWHVTNQVTVLSWVFRHPRVYCSLSSPSTRAVKHSLQLPAGRRYTLYLLTCWPIRALLAALATVTSQGSESQDDPGLVQEECL